MGYDVAPEHLGGFAEMLVTVRDPADAAASHIAAHGDADDLDGILGDLLRGVVVEATGKVYDVAVAANVALDYAGGALRKTAWEYSVEDGHNKARFDGTQLSGLEALPDSVPYPVDTYPDLPIPHSKLPSPSDVGDGTNDIIDFVDWLVGLLGESPLGFTLRKILCDWRVLDKAGIAMQAAGHRIDHVCDDITQGMLKMLHHWEGTAAEAFRGHLNLIIEGSRDVAATARLVGASYKIAAELVKLAAEELIKGLNAAVDDFLGHGFFSVLWKLIKRGIPFIGQIIALDDARRLFVKLKLLVTQTEALIDKIAMRLKTVILRKIVAHLGGNKLQGAKIDGALTSIGQAGGKIDTFVRQAIDKFQLGEQIAEDADELENSPGAIDRIPEAHETYDRDMTKQDLRRMQR